MVAHGPAVGRGPYYTRNGTCSLAKAVEYSEATSRAGGSTPADTQNMIEFPQGAHYVMSVANGTWACGARTQSVKTSLTYGSPRIRVTNEGRDLRCPFTKRG